MHKRGGEEVNFITNATRGRKCSRERGRSLFNKRERERERERERDGGKDGKRRTGDETNERTNGDDDRAAF